MTVNRREFLKTSGWCISVIGLGGIVSLLTPGEARARNVALKVLTQTEKAIAEAFIDILLPGAAEAGGVHFIDEQLAKPANESLLMARYLQVEPPYSRFYQGSLLALDNYSQKRWGKPFVDLDYSSREKLVEGLFRMSEEGEPLSPEGWQGPPAALVYLCFRSDAVDVVYGTESGFEDLGIPYMAHIVPPQRW